MSTINERPAGLTINSDGEIRVVTVGQVGPAGADGVGPIDVTGYGNALITAEQETLTPIGGGPSGVEGYTDDLRENLIGANVDVSTGRIDYDYDNNGIGFADNARYPNEACCTSFQLPHSWVEGTDFELHLHWGQNQAAQPNWLVLYRVWKKGADIPGGWYFATGDASDNIYSYGGETLLHQIVDLVAIDMTGCTVSDIVQVKLFRDVANDSGQFAGADTYSGDALAIYMDAHILKNSIGSVGEYDKDGL
jgi:hypothetical protein